MKNFGRFYRKINSQVKYYLFVQGRRGLYVEGEIEVGTARRKGGKTFVLFFKAGSSLD